MTKKNPLEMSLKDWTKEINKCIQNELYWHNNYFAREAKNIDQKELNRLKKEGPELAKSIQAVFPGVILVNNQGDPDGRVIYILKKSIKENKNVHVVYRKSAK